MRQGAAKVREREALLGRNALVLLFPFQTLAAGNVTWVGAKHLAGTFMFFFLCVFSVGLRCGLLSLALLGVRAFFVSIAELLCLEYLAKENDAELRVCERRELQRIYAHRPLSTNYPPHSQPLSAHTPAHTHSHTQAAAASSTTQTSPLRAEKSS